MKEYIRPALSLFVITLVAAFLLAGVNVLTKDKIAAVETEKQNAAMRTLVSEADEFESLNDDIYVGYNGNDVAGYCVNVTTAGYGGDISMTVGIKADGSIAGIEILSNSETAGLGARCTEESFKSQFAGLEYPAVAVKGDASGSGQISAITGATITSTAVAKGVNEAYDILLAYFDEMEGADN